jgi:hypothetical protein
VIVGTLAARLKRLEAFAPPEPLAIRITSFADPPTPEEEAFLEAEVRRRIEAGEGLIITMWSGRQARKLGAPEREKQAPSRKLAITIASPDGRRLRL